jgi:hypothetical protein
VVSFGKHFSEAELWRKDKTWIQFPLRDNVADGCNLTVSEEDALIELSTDSTYGNIYKYEVLISCEKDYPQLTSKAMRSLLPPYTQVKADFPLLPTLKIPWHENFTS